MEVDDKVTLSDIMRELKDMREENKKLKQLYAKLYSLSPEKLDELGIHDELYSLRPEFVAKMGQVSEEESEYLSSEESERLYDDMKKKSD
jgi:ribosomal 50S subunit-associated protein YjgA (DUF615 family)